MIAQRFILLLSIILLMPSSTFSSQGIKALVRNASNITPKSLLPMQPNQQRSIAKPIAYNNAGAAIGIAAILAAGLAWLCGGCEVSDQTLLITIDKTLDSGSRKIAQIGGQENMQVSLIAEQLSEQALAYIAQHMPHHIATDHLHHLDSIIKQLSEHKTDLLKRIQEKAQKADQVNLKNAMQSKVTEIERVLDLLRNRYTIVNHHERYFNLYNTQKLIFETYNKLLQSISIDPQDIRAFAINTYKTRFPILTFIDQLNEDIQACSQPLRSYVQYPFMQQQIQNIKNKLENLRDDMLKSDIYQQALKDKQQWELEQEKIALERKRLAIEQQKADAAHVTAQAAKLQAEIAQESKKREQESQKTPQEGNRAGSDQEEA